VIKKIRRSTEEIFSRSFLELRFRRSPLSGWDDRQIWLPKPVTKAEIRRKGSPNSRTTALNHVKAHAKVPARILATRNVSADAIRHAQAIAAAHAKNPANMTVPAAATRHVIKRARDRVKRDPPREPFSGDLSARWTFGGIPRLKYRRASFFFPRREEAPGRTLTAPVIISRIVYDRRDE
jgi:hypothetical protein